MCITKLGGDDKMFSVRLPEELEKKLNILSKEKNTTKSEIVKEALAQYIAVNSEKLVSYDLGKEFFGRYGSGDDNRSETYKKKLKEKFHEKNTR
jgi:predicted DNA-binding protein